MASDRLYKSAYSHEQNFEDISWESFNYSRGGDLSNTEKSCLLEGISGSSIGHRHLFLPS